MLTYKEDTIMPYTKCSKFFDDWFHRKFGGLYDEHWMLDLLPDDPNGREKMDRALIRLAWRAYTKGKRDGKRGYTEYIVRKDVGMRNRKKPTRAKIMMREGE